MSVQQINTITAKILRFLSVAGAVGVLVSGVAWGQGLPAPAQPPVSLTPPILNVDCTAGDSIQAAVDLAAGPTMVFISGPCTEDVLITKDDVTLSGNEAGAECDKADPGGTGAIDGTITIKSVRSRIEFLTVTGGGDGILVTDRGAAELTCNLVDFNQKTGVVVTQASQARLVKNTLSRNGQQGFDRSTVFFDCGLFAGDASAVQSFGNTYRDNSYCAIEVDRQSAFRNGSFVPRASEFPVDNPDERDVFIQYGCDPVTEVGCLNNDSARLAVLAFNGGLVDLRNAEVYGFTTPFANSSFRLDETGEMLGNIAAGSGTVVRIRNRNNIGRNVSFTGTLSCGGGSQTFGSSVQCGQTCNGLDASGNLQCTP